MAYVPQSSTELSARRIREQKKQRRRKRIKRWFFGSLLTCCILFSALVVFGFATPWGRSMRMLLAEAVITSSHRSFAHLITLPSEYNQLLAQINQVPVQTGVPNYIQVSTAKSGDTSTTPTNSEAPAKKYAHPVEFQKISGPGWNGYAMLIHDPKLMRLVPAHEAYGKGEYVTSMVKRTGAIAGVNASGFNDPNGSSWGKDPVGLVMIDGKVMQSERGTESWTSIGFTKDGIMVMGRYTPTQLKNLGVRDAIQFHPELVVNGKKMITYGDGGWGAGPRTAIGQTKDGTVIFLVINGRFKGGAGMGATQKQVMEEMLKFGAVNACALDGGSSSVLYGEGRILNTPSTLDPNGQRHLPNAWLIFSTEEEANQPHW